MAAKYSKTYNPSQTPQTAKAPGTVKNSAGGYSFAVDKWTMLNRFLILGSEGGSYYASEKKATVFNAKNVMECIKEDGLRTVKTAVEISTGGRAPKNSPALYVHALASVHGDVATRKLAFDTLSSVARTGTHLFEWVDYRNDLGGFGSGVRKAIADWYTSKGLKDIAFQIMKYGQREGWTHMDVLRLSHVKPTSSEMSALFRYAKEKAKKLPITTELLPKNILAAEELLRADISLKEKVALISSNRLPMEVIPKEMLNSREVWEALVKDLPVTATIRNLNKMTSLGMFDDSKIRNLVIDRITSEVALVKGRVHPLNLLVGLKTYSSGRGMKGSNTWTPHPKIVDALDAAFYTAFKAVTPTNKRLMLALDISSSMCWATIAGMGITPREGSAAMAMVTEKVESDVMIAGFSTQFSKLNISSRKRLDDIVNYLNGLPFGGTDCSLPMIFAEKNKLDIDAFVVYTDSETWAGNIHPFEALKKYRQARGIPAKLIVVGMVANQFSIADPSDAGMLDVVGFDTSVPNVMSEFITH